MAPVRGSVATPDATVIVDNPVTVPVPDTSVNVTCEALSVVTLLPYASLRVAVRLQEVPELNGDAQPLSATALAGPGPVGVKLPL